MTFPKVIYIINCLDHCGLVLVLFKLLTAKMLVNLQIFFGRFISNSVHLFYITQMIFTLNWIVDFKTITLMLSHYYATVKILVSRII